MNAATEARLMALPDPNASPDRWHDLLNRLAAARMRSELAEMEAADVTGVDPYGLAASA